MTRSKVATGWLRKIWFRWFGPLLLAGVFHVTLAIAQKPPLPPELPLEPGQPDPLAAPAEQPQSAEASGPTPTEIATQPLPAEVRPSEQPVSADAVMRQVVRPRQLGLNPGTPRTPGGIALGEGAGTAGVEMEPGWAFQFHGYLAAPLAVGIAGVNEPAPGQSSFTLHTPPDSSDTWGAFSYANVVPGPWVQLNLSYGNQWVTGTVIVAGYSISSASAWFNPGAQLGINKAFLTFDLPEADHWRFLWHVGAFGNTYGHMSVYDNGRYETPLVAATNGVGETVTAEYETGDLKFQLEQGLQGHLDIAPQAIRDNSFTGSTPVSSQGITGGTALCPTDPPRTAAEQTEGEQTAQLLGPAYGWPDCNVGSSFVHHLHAGFGMADQLHFALHWLHAFSSDDRTPSLPAVQRDPQPSLPARAQPKGTINVYGADLRWYGQQFGNLYLGLNHTKLVDASTVGNVINILNAGGGPGLSRFYLGPESRGNGSLTAIGTQYDLSLGRLLRHPQPFWGEGPDLTASLYGMFVSVRSADDAFDGLKRLKFGSEWTYNLLSWFSVQGRYDHVVPDLDDSDQNRDVVTARLIAKTEWLSHERVWLQYSHFFDSPGVVDPFEGQPPSDRDLVALVATMWW